MIFESIIEESSKENYSSCFLIKTQLELADEGNELHKLASVKSGEIETLFQSYLEKEFSKTVSRKRAVSLMLHILA